MVSLSELISQIDEMDDHATVYATLPWGPESEATTAHEGSEEADAALNAGQAYLLEVLLVKDVLDTWKSWRDRRSPSADEAVEAVVHYAQTDAYLPP